MRPLPLALLLALLILSACTPAPASFQMPSPVFPAWVRGDLRVLDASDTSNPAQDLAAVYIRRLDPPGWPASFTRAEWQLRLEMLDLGTRQEADIYLALDHAPGGATRLPGGARSDLAWDTLLLLPASGALHAWDDRGQPRDGLALRVLRDPDLDTVQIAWRASALPGASGMRVQVFITPPGRSQAVDTSLAFSAFGPPPASAEVLLAFRDVFPAYTPAQALRRWDGAHTGPNGGRHGLFNLLRTARNHQVPLALLDVKNPASLSALEAVGGVSLLRQMEASGLLLLPDLQPLGPAAGFSALSRQAGLDFGLSASPWVFLPQGGSPPSGYHGAIVLASSVASAQGGLYRQANLRWLVISQPSLPDQAGPEGPSLEVRRALLQAAQNAAADRSAILVLGGSLPESTWGDPIRARQAFRYLTSRPWVHFLTPHDLMALTPAASGLESPLPPYSPSPPPTEAQLEEDPLRYEFSTLYAPVWPAADGLAGLRRVYAGQQSILRLAERWSQAPELLETASGCTRDLDEDGMPECLLSSPQVLAVFDPASGALTYLFVRGTPGLHQLVAPTSQLALGLSDPSGWDLSAKLRADPAVIPGAFSGLPGAPQITAQAGRLVFERQGYQQSYRLLPAGLHAEISAPAPLTLQIPLVLDPWERFTPGWPRHYTGEGQPAMWTWSLEGGPRLIVRTSAQLSAAAFSDSLHFLDATEDPNREYPAGHYLPFPLALVEVGGQPAFRVDIEISGD